MLLLCGTGSLSIIGETMWAPNFEAGCGTIKVKQIVASIDLIVVDLISDGDILGKDNIVLPPSTNWVMRCNQENQEKSSGVYFVTKKVSGSIGKAVEKISMVSQVHNRYE